MSPVALRQDEARVSGALRWLFGPGVSSDPASFLVCILQWRCRHRICVTRLFCSHVKGKKRREGPQVDGLETWTQSSRGGPEGQRVGEGLGWHAVLPPSFPTLWGMGPFLGL